MIMKEGAREISSRRETLIGTADFEDGGGGKEQRNSRFLYRMGKSSVDSQQGDRDVSPTTSMKRILPTM